MSKKTRTSMAVEMTPYGRSQFDKPHTGVLVGWTNDGYLRVRRGTNQTVTRYSPIFWRPAR